MYTWGYGKTISQVHVSLLSPIGKQILDRHYEDIKDAIASGTVDNTKAVGLLDQWLIEGKFNEEEALILCCDMLAAGMDTVSRDIWS